VLSVASCPGREYQKFRRGFKQGAQNFFIIDIL